MVEVTGGLRKLHYEELRNLYFSLDIVRMIRSRKMILAGHVARMGEMGNAYDFFYPKPEEGRPLGRPRRR
jgi:hypothetical protein